MPCNYSREAVWIDIILIAFSNLSLSAFLQICALQHRRLLTEASDNPATPNSHPYEMLWRIMPVLALENKGCARLGRLQVCWSLKSSFGVPSSKSFFNSFLFHFLSISSGPCRVRLPSPSLVCCPRSLSVSCPPAPRPRLHSVRASLANSFPLT